MSIEDIIKWLERLANGADAWAIDARETETERKMHERQAETLRAAIEKLRTHPDAQTNEPLTLDELREMDGKPVYVMCDDGTYCWGIVSAGHGKVIVRDQYGMSADVVIWMPRGEKYYRRPPKEA